MKSFLMILLLCALLAGCAAPPEAPITVLDTQPPVTAELPTEPSATAPAATVTYTLYIPNDDAETFTEVTIETNQISSEHVLAALQKYDVLPENVALNAFGSSGSQLTMDFNRPFGDLISSTGTSGERMITGSVFNTFLNAFQAESIVFTVEGEILESGHVIYDFPIGYIE